MVKPNAYYDSVTLMKISVQVSKLRGIACVLVGMGTDLNKDSLKRIGLLTPECENTTPNDLMIGIRADDENSLNSAGEKIEELLTNKDKGAADNKEKVYERIEEVAQLKQGYNMAVISVPGVYAAREARKALENDMHVFLFSDNVTVDEEIELKDIAISKGLLMMGPDCGTAIINGIPLGFANRVRRGNIGIAGASGTGIQQVATLIHSLGAGISQAIGTGGRDLSARVSGRTMLMALDALKDDPATEIVVIISKPPADEVAKKVFTAANSINKKVVLCLLGADKREGLGENIIQCSSLEETAVKAASLALGRRTELKAAEDYYDIINNFDNIRRPEQKYVRGVFCGGTLCDEAMTVFRRKGIKVFSNVPAGDDEKLEYIEKSTGNTFLDMGDDYFTKGKPHPMIEPGLRNKRIIQEALDPETAVMIIDVEIGHGSHADPAGLAAEAAALADIELSRLERKVLWIAVLIGTEEDPQNYEEQMKKLRSCGFMVFESNVRAAEFAAGLVRS